eukprot:TRINITY_DN3021_c0_g1_i1.p1 TRINITY_DN3021_c0_g1~~TRINITY_DN3021_c0_g1_i1.p1  ORF type:complete len:662 (+),score=96.44 TRINITY_DN3021_c0_g1_i1:99-2084(+)
MEPKEVSTTSTQPCTKPVVYSVSGSVVVAEHATGVAQYEVVHIGPHRLLGEVTQLSNDRATIHVFGDTSRLRPGDAVELTGKPLSVELGPGLLGQTFNSLQQPIEYNTDTQTVFWPQQQQHQPPAALDKTVEWFFEPQHDLQVGSRIGPGDIYGQVVENTLLVHRIMLPPDATGGTVTWLAPHGDYTLNHDVLEVEYRGRRTKYKMYHTWPVRKPRPVAETRLGSDVPLLTGIRSVDTFCPPALGGSATMPAGTGAGKSVVYWALTANANVDVVVNVWIGEQSTNLAAHLIEAPELAFKIGDHQDLLIKKMVVVANSADMPLAAREASVYTGITVAEYWRDMGYHVALTADDTSRWAEALTELSCRAGMLPGDRGYAVDLKSRLNGFYQRAGYVQCLGSKQRFGSLSIISTVSPPLSDYERDPVVAATIENVGAFIALDSRLSQTRHFPQVNWMLSHSKHSSTLEAFYDGHIRSSDEFVRCCKVAKQILTEEHELKPDIGKAGLDSLSQADQATLQVAKMLREDFLRQNIFTPYDRHCPLYKTAALLRNFVLYHELVQDALQQHGQSSSSHKHGTRTGAGGGSGSGSGGQKNSKESRTAAVPPLTFQDIQSALSAELYELVCMKFQDPADGEAAMLDVYSNLARKLRRSMDDLLEPFWASK